MQPRFLIALAFVALPATSVTALTQAEVRTKTTGGVEVTSGACTGLTGNSFGHAAKRCDCMQKLGGSVMRDGSVNTRGVDQASWFACVGR